MVPFGCFDSHDNIQGTYSKMPTTFHNSVPGHQAFTRAWQESPLNFPPWAPPVTYSVSFQTNGHFGRENCSGLGGTVIGSRLWEARMDVDQGILLVQLPTMTFCDDAG